MKEAKKRLTLKRSACRAGTFGGWVLFGRTEGVTRRFRGRTTDWLEKWFPDTTRAENYARKLGYEVERLDK